MGVFDGGVELERIVLKTLLTDESCCLLNSTKLKEDYFSSEARRFVFNEINKELIQNNSAMSEQVLESIITLQHGNEYVTYMGEKNLILNAKTTKNINSVIRLLHEMWVGRETNACLESVAELIGSGHFVDAAKLFRQKAFTIQIEQNVKKTKEFFSSIKERISRVRDKRDNPEKYRGLKTGLATFDLQTGGLFPGEMTLLAGVTGLGKSTILKQMEYGLLLNNPGKNVLHIANEEYEDQVDSKFDSVFTGIDYHSFKFARKEDVPEEVLKNWEIHIEKIAKECKGKLFTKEVPAFSDVSLIRRAVHELKAQGIDIHAIFIDHLPNMKPVQPAYGENNEREKCAAECKELARELQVPVVVPTQAATVVEEKQNKGKRASKLDVYGSKAQIHHANTFFIITFLGKDAKTIRSDGSPETLEYLRDVFILCDVKKNRDGACFSFKLRHHVRNGRMEEIEISPEIKKRFEEEMAAALKSGDFSTSIIDEEAPKKDSAKGITVLEQDESEHGEGF
ncbi:MAG: hypothetical protein M0P12_00680 [Paludibacteraceae bacterium]|nr:hypothetical protein [Paludibacteraceae bacterium]